MLAVAARETSKIKLGHFVTNPATRDPTVLASSYATLHDLSDGRMAMGIGRGDSAVRYIGRQPMKVAEFERACAMVREFMNGREVNWNDKELQLKWVREELPEIPMWIAGYGPKALAVAGRVADGVIIQLADPEIITLDHGHRAQGRRGGGPRPVAAQVHRRRAEPRHRRPRRRARAGALVPGDGVEPRHGSRSSATAPTAAPSRRRSPTTCRRASSTTTTSTRASARSTASSSPTRSATASACSATTEQIKAKLKELEEVGVDQFNIYLMTHGQEETLQAYGDEIISEFAGVTA